MLNKAKVLSISSLLLCAGLLGGCNTMQGIGQDIEAAGQGIEKSATKNKEY